MGPQARRLGRSIRTIRVHLGLRQVDAAMRVGISQATWSRVETGHLDGVAVGVLVRMLEALDARLDLRASRRGAALDRLLDEGHASLAGAGIEWLRRHGWLVAPEVSYSAWGERGSIDILAWHAATRTLLVIEVKTELGSVEALLRGLDTKARLASALARDRMGWRAATVARLAIIGEERANRRAVERHAVVLGAALPIRGWQVRRWLAAPAGAMAGLWFVSRMPGVDAARNPSAIRRVAAHPRTRR